MCFSAAAFRRRLKESTRSTGSAVRRKPAHHPVRRARRPPAPKLSNMQSELYMSGRYRRGRLAERPVERAVAAAAAGAARPPPSPPPPPPGLRERRAERRVDVGRRAVVAERRIAAPGTAPTRPPPSPRPPPPATPARRWRGRRRRRRRRPPPALAIRVGSRPATHPPSPPPSAGGRSASPCARGCGSAAGSRSRTGWTEHLAVLAVAPPVGHLFSMPSEPPRPRRELFAVARFDASSPVRAPLLLLVLRGASAGRAPGAPPPRGPA